VLPDDGATTVMTFVALPVPNPSGKAWPRRGGAGVLLGGGGAAYVVRGGAECGADVLAGDALRDKLAGCGVVRRCDAVGVTTGVGVAATLGTTASPTLLGVVDEVGSVVQEVCAVWAVCADSAAAKLTTMTAQPPMAARTAPVASTRDIRM
jgi:hypothetical protein